MQAGFLQVSVETAEDSADLKEHESRRLQDNELWPCCDLTCPAASVNPHRALEATPTLSPKAATSPVLQCCEMPAIASPRT